jgi:hypothetical protein
MEDEEIRGHSVRLNARSVKISLWSLNGLFSRGRSVRLMRMHTRMALLDLEGIRTIVGFCS